ncbi:TPA: hypothetical protein ACGOVI_001480 [Streptococcus suis]
MSIKRRIEQMKDEPYLTREQLNSMELVIRDSLLSETWDKSTTDYLGNSFETAEEMAEFHNINLSRIKRIVLRKKRMKAERYLINLLSDREWRQGEKDHLGNSFDTLEEVVGHYGIDLSELISKVKNEQYYKAILSPGEDGLYRDHLGNPFETTKQLARFYGIDIDRLKDRLRRGWTFQEALTTPVSGKNKKHVLSTRKS